MRIARCFLDNIEAKATVGNYGISLLRLGKSLATRIHGQATSDSNGKKSERQLTRRWKK